MIVTVKAVLFDGDGVLYIADQVQPQTRELLKWLRDTGIDICLVTNNSTKTITHYHRKLTDLGIDILKEHVITSSYVTATFLKNTLPEINSVYLIGEEGLFDAFTSNGFEVVNGKDDWYTRIADAVVVGMDRLFSYQKMSAAMDLISKGAKYFATGSDKTFPTPNGFRPGAGAMLGAINSCVGREPDLIIGKPSPQLFEHALESLGFSPNEILMIGDRYETDILGATRLGIKPVLIRTGVGATYQPKDLEQFSSLHQDLLIIEELNQIKSLLE